jgi:hypothetical protein
MCNTVDQMRLVNALCRFADEAERMGGPPLRAVTHGSQRKLGASQAVPSVSLLQIRSGDPWADADVRKGRRRRPCLSRDEDARAVEVRRSASSSTQAKRSPKPSPDGPDPCWALFVSRRSGDHALTPLVSLSSFDATITEGQRRGST